MKKIVRFLLTVSLMLSLSVFANADCQLVRPPDYDPSSFVVPYSLYPSSSVPFILTSRPSTSTGGWVYLTEQDNLYVGSGAILSSQSTQYPNCIFFGKGDFLPVNRPNYWWNFIGKITDANGYVLQASDFNAIGIQVVSSGNFGPTQGYVSRASDNTYQWNDGYLQICVSDVAWSFSNAGYTMFINVTNSSVVAPLSFEVEVFEAYIDESSTTAYPFVFGGTAHIDTSVPEGPKDPNDHSQYGSASDQVEWYNDAFGGAVDPELDDRMGEATDMLLQEQEIEDQVISGLNQYSSQVDPAILTFPTQIVNGLSFIGSTFMSSYNALGDIGFVISLSMMLGVVLVLIGRGESALAREKANARYERRRDENRAYYENMRNKSKGG